MMENNRWTPDFNNGSGSLYLRLVEALATAIENGELAVSKKLLPQRQLAWHLDINLSIVTKKPFRRHPSAT